MSVVGGRGLGDSSILSAIGLRTVLGSGLALFAGPGVVLVSTFGVFVGPISQAMNWERALVAAALAPATMITALFVPGAGWLSDRYGPRRVILGYGFCFALGLALLGSSSSSLALFGALVALAGVLGAGLSPIPTSQLVVGWFDRHRGLALGLIQAFGGLGVAIMPPVAAIAIHTWGWQGAYRVLGLTVLVIVVPVAIWVLRDPPRHFSPKAELDVRMPASGLSAREAIATRTFWLLIPAFFLASITALGGFISLPLLLADTGVAPTRAAFLVSFTGISMIVARIVFGALLDRFSAHRLTASAFLCPAAANLLLATGVNEVTAVIAAILFGLAAGAEGDALGYIVAKEFGMKNFGKLYGMIFFTYAAGSGLGPSFILALRERLGGETAMCMLAGLAVIAAILMLAGQAKSAPAASTAGAVS